MKNGRGLFITIEGGDASGKTTQIKKLEELIKELKLDYILTREPGGTKLGEEVRVSLLKNREEKVSDIAEMLLYAASRAQHVEEIIKPALREGKIVISDRYVDSSIAYQGYGNNIIEETKIVNSIATKGELPDRTYLIMVDMEESRKRLISRETNVLDRIESKSDNYHKKVLEGFLDIAREEERIKIINGKGSVEDTWKEIEKDVLNLIKITYNIEKR